ncbi:hypothetical protein ACO0LG_17780 [Undibacterium sp. Ji42W]|uniref:hypothetical protein n=1 Tax=Undibacterium sp. Ji42W TaxID=3413039 RepID=UPI003BF31588
MLQIAATILQIISFLAEHKEQIKKLILDIENLIPATPGSSKALIVRNFIATSLSIEAQMEPAWPFVSSLFNDLVAFTKRPG